MPFYEYRCDKCGHEDSFLENINAPQIKTCPQCGKRRAFKRLISAAGFQLKGDGWYVTDFRDKNKKKPTKDDKEEKATDKKDNADDKSKKTDDKTADKSGKTDKNEKPADKKTEKSADKRTPAKNKTKAGS